MRYKYLAHPVDDAKFKEAVDEAGYEFVEIELS